MRKTYTFDPIGLLRLIAYVLLIVGIIPFTPGWIGALFILSECEMKFSIG